MMPPIKKKTCSLCRTTLNQAWKRHSEVLQTHTLRPAGDTAFPEIPERRPPEQEKYEMIGLTIATNKVADPNQTWTLRFDGSKSKRGAGAGVELISPTGETYLASYWLQFHCTNNIAEYESLIHGLLLAIKKGSQILHCFGDSEVVVRQVRKQYTCHDKRLSIYHNLVWDIIESFDAFNIKAIFRSQNQVADSLAQAASTLEPLSMQSFKKFILELTSVPSVLDNVTNFKAFDDDKNIIYFITSSDVFAT